MCIVCTLERKQANRLEHTYVFVFETKKNAHDGKYVLLFLFVYHGSLEICICMPRGLKLMKMWVHTAQKNEKK